MAKLKAQTCPVCSAPLPVGPTDADVTCRYCGTAIHVERAKPPPPPPHGVDPAVAPRTVYVDPNAGKAVTRLVLGVTLVPAIISVLLVVIPTIVRRSGSTTSSLPAKCGLNQELTIKGATFSGSGTLVEAAINCRLRIVDSKLTGDVIVHTSGLSNIEIENSTLVGNDVALQLAGNTTVKISKRSTVKSPSTAISGEVNTNLTLVDSKIEGETAIRGTINVTIDGKNSEITGKDRAVAVGTNGKLRLVGSTLLADDVVVEGDSNLEVNLEGGAIRGGDTAIKGGVNTKVRAVKKGVISAKDVAVAAGTNLQLTLEDATLASESVGVKTELNPKIKVAKGATLSGVAKAIDVGSNLELEVSAGTIESAGTAVEAEGNARIVAKKGAIKGGVFALALARAPQELNVSDAQIVGAQSFDPSKRQPDVARPTREPKKPGASATPTPTPTSTAQAAVAKPVVAKPPPPKPPAFETATAVSLLDQAEKQAEAACKSSNGRAAMVFVNPSFQADGSNAPVFSDPRKWTGTPEGACVLPFFQRVRIPAFDPDTRPGGMGRGVNLKP